ncbi:hypothetical protein VTJ49DRAFT_1648 [Mycothermus thermophilus]|uniref:Uncharacterized protein n=1 Tax=Humicola insolens TaxID=85995 RepID=A0ABR3VCG8_HUMIN
MPRIPNPFTRQREQPVAGPDEALGAGNWRWRPALPQGGEFWHRPKSCVGAMDGSAEAEQMDGADCLLGATSWT